MTVFRRNRLSLVKISLVIFILVLLLSTSHLPYSPSNKVVPANSTLGFGTILAVSHTNSPRRPSLIWAANLTSLDIVIPVQPTWTPDDILAFRANNASSISQGSALAWLGHLNALKHFLTTTHSTALILEDDTDFDISIRSTQIPLLAASLRHLTNTPSTPATYWAHHTWDLLYPGHCDDLPSPHTYLSSPHIAYKDSTSPPHALLHPATAHFLATLNAPSQTRILHRAIWPFCTFAYGVTRASASHILNSFAREKEGGISAFDVQLLEACRDQGWRCWSVVPELFHHGGGRSEIGVVDGEEGGGVGRTWNLRCGVRDGGLAGRGECDVDGEKGWVGCEWGECGGQS